MTSDRSADYALVGGGLQNSLIALALRARRPDARVVMIERGAALGGNHTWCFHAGDLDDDRASWVAPLVVHRWPGYDVAFDSYTRALASPYACVTSERLAQVVGAGVDGARVEGAPKGGAPLDIWLGHEVVECSADRVVARGPGGTRTLHARVVIDARGPEQAPRDACGWQTFVGQELELTAPHGLTQPMLMDATVAQDDGFRFVYVLPLAEDRVLVEDTYYRDAPEIAAATWRARIADYVAARGWRIASVVREEQGALPLPWQPPTPRAGLPWRAGYAGGWFHPVTGYSFPIASRLAAAIAALPVPSASDDPAAWCAALAPLVDGHARQLRFASRLARMLFHWFAPADRHRVLERFYRLPEDVIRRFYALELSAGDRARILIGRPPRGLSLRGMLGGRPA